MGTFFLAAPNWAALGAAAQFGSASVAEGQRRPAEAAESPICGLR